MRLFMATKIDDQYLKEAFDFNIKEKLRTETLRTTQSMKAIFNRLYDSLFYLAVKDDCRVKSLTDMERRLDSDEKKEYFKQAQAYQLIYQFTNGKNSLIIPDNFNIDAKAWDYCSDTIRIMRFILDFNQPTLFTKY